MSLETALGIASSGLAYVTRALAQAGQDVSNAKTAGYTRKSLDSVAADIGGTPFGVRTLGVQRDVDAALVARLATSRGATAAATVREGLLQGIEAAHGTPGDAQGLGDLVNKLGNLFTGLRADPGNLAGQAAVVNGAQDLVDRLHAIAGAIGDARQAAQDGLVTEVGVLNAGLRRVAGLTGQIQAEVASGGSAAALEDQRDQAIAGLNESLGIRAVPAPNGGLTLLARNGLVVPLSTTADAFTVAPIGVTPASYRGAGGSLPGVMLNGEDVTGRLAGGRLAEYATLRDATLPRYQAEADLAAGAIASRFDAQGLRLFSAPDGSVPDTTLPYAGGAQVGLAGMLVVNPRVVANPTLVRNGTTAVAAGAGGASAFTPNPAGGPAGFTTLIDRVLGNALGGEVAAGTPQPGIATTGLGPDGSLASPFSGTRTLADYAALLTASQTGDRAAATSARTDAQALQTGLETRFAARSGVDTDAELSNIVQLQNSYAANARVMSTVQNMWDSLLAAVR